MWSVYTVHMDGPMYVLSYVRAARSLPLFGVSVSETGVHRVEPLHTRLRNHRWLTIFIKVENRARAHTHTQPWRDELNAKRQEFPMRYPQRGDAIVPEYAIQVLGEETEGEAIITTGVGQHQMWAAQWYPYKVWKCDLCGSCVHHA